MHRPPQPPAAAADAASQKSSVFSDLLGPATLDGLAVVPLVLVALVSLAAVLYDLGMLTAST